MAAPDLLVTPADYLRRERAAETKSELVDGRVYARPSASRAHSLIAGSICAELRGQLRGRPCEPHASDMRVTAPPYPSYFYPDVSVACGEPQFEDASVDVLLNPMVVVEVLSPSTERFDRGGKFARYRMIDSLREYVLVAQDEPRVEVYTRHEGGAWLMREFVGLDASVDLASIECRLALREVYERVEFSPA